jgi:hypothetical protein
MLPYLLLHVKAPSFCLLHRVVTLQKLWFLLTTSARGGARLWVLMNAEHVALELRAALCSVAMARDVLPPHDAWDDEARELATLILDQAWRAAAMRPDPKDNCAAWSVRSTLVPDNA